MSQWDEVVAPRPMHRAGGHPAIAVVAPFAIAAVLLVLDLRLAALVLALTGAVLGLVRLVRPTAAARFDRALVAVGTGLAHAVSVVLLGLVYALVFAPVAALSRIARRDPLDRHGGDGPSRWQARAAAAPATTRRTFGLEDRRTPSGSKLALVPRVVGWVVLALAVNYSLGWLWDEYAGSHDVPQGTPDEALVAGDYAATPAMADEPWADEWWSAFDELRYDYVPFLLSRVADVEGPLLSSEGGERGGYEPADATAEVWLLGGGAAWGQGQRDDHTLASALARRSEEVGRPVRVRNFAQPGYTTLQSALLLERLLDAGPPPDAIVVYGGADDVAVRVEQADSGFAGPTHYGAVQTDQALSTARERTTDLWDEYRETSLLTRWADGLTSVFGVQAAAADGDLLATARPLVDDHLAMIEDLAARDDVPTVLTWQAAIGVPGDGGAYRDLAASDPAAVDLSDVLDGHDDHVLDGVLTDEDGARLVADALWPLVEDALGTPAQPAGS